MSDRIRSNSVAGMNLIALFKLKLFFTSLLCRLSKERWRSILGFLGQSNLALIFNRNEDRIVCWAWEDKTHAGIYPVRFEPTVIGSYSWIEVEVFQLTNHDPILQTFFRLQLKLRWILNQLKRLKHVMRLLWLVKISAVVQLKLKLKVVMGHGPRRPL